MDLFDVLPQDHKFYNDRIKDFLPDRLFDAHTHVFLKEKADKLMPAAPARTAGWPALVADRNPAEDLERTAELMFPGKEYAPLMFGSVSDASALDEINAYVASCARKRGYPALMVASPAMDAGALEDCVAAGGFKGIKVYLTFAPAYIPADEIRIFDFLSREHLEVCDSRGWTVMLHIARPARLRDPVNLAQLLEIEGKYKSVKLIVAHVGRAYCDADADGAFEALKSAERMLFDISANTNTRIFERLIRAVGSSRILFGSDLPITRMRMRRVERGGTYVNLTPRGLYGDVSGDKNMGVLDPPESDGLTFFMYEEIEAFRQAAIRTGLKEGDIERVFWSNAARLFDYKKQRAAP